MKKLLSEETYHLKIGWLYPELMSTYGDRGNIMVLSRRLEWRQMGASVVPINFTTTDTEIMSCDILFGGGAQDRQQGMVIDDLRERVGPILKSQIEKNIPGLFVCGSPQLLGVSYMNYNGEQLQGLNIFDMESRHFGKKKPRCIGNTIAKITGISVSPKDTVVGFENHGGRTYLGKNVQPFAKIIVGNGNNGEDKTEGAVYNNCIATYAHGPLLPRNPHIADWIIQKALQIKYKKEIQLQELNDTLAWQAHDAMLLRYGVKK